eukprot:gene27182-biopygen7172
MFATGIELGIGAADPGIGSFDSKLDSSCEHDIYQGYQSIPRLSTLLSSTPGNQHYCHQHQGYHQQGNTPQGNHTKVPVLCCFGWVESSNPPSRFPLGIPPQHNVQRSAKGGPSMTSVVVK